MDKVNREVICIGIKYSVKIEPMYMEWDKLIPTLEKHFPDILKETLDHDHHRCNSEKGLSAPVGSSDNNTNFRYDHTDIGHMQRPPSPRLS